MSVVLQSSNVMGKFFIHEMTAKATVATVVAAIPQ